MIFVLFTCFQLVGYDLILCSSESGHHVGEVFPLKSNLTTCPVKITWIPNPDELPNGPDEREKFDNATCTIARSAQFYYFANCQLNPWWHTGLIIVGFFLMVIISPAWYAVLAAIECDVQDGELLGYTFNRILPPDPDPPVTLYTAGGIFVFILGLVVASYNNSCDVLTCGYITRYQNRKQFFDNCVDFFRSGSFLISAAATIYTTTKNRRWWVQFDNYIWRDQRRDEDPIFDFAPADYKTMDKALLAWKANAMAAIFPDDQFLQDMNKKLLQSIHQDEIPTAVDYKSSGSNASRGSRASHTSKSKKKKKHPRRGSRGSRGSRGILDNDDDPEQ